MVLGVTGPLLVLFHANFSFGATNSNVALICMLLVAGSGVVGRYIYTRLHAHMDGHESTLEQLRSVGERLRAQSTSIAFLPGVLDVIARVEQAVHRATAGAAGARAAPVHRRLADPHCPLAGVPGDRPGVAGGAKPRRGASSCAMRTAWRPWRAAMPTGAWRRGAAPPSTVSMRACSPSGTSFTSRCSSCSWLQESCMWSRSTSTDGQTCGAARFSRCWEPGGLLLLCLGAGAAGAASVETLLMPGKVRKRSRKAGDHLRQLAMTAPTRALRPPCAWTATSRLPPMLRTHRGYHGRMANAGAGECRACHTEHKGRTADIVQLDRAHFDHQLTDFSPARCACRAALRELPQAAGGLARRGRHLRRLPQGGRCRIVDSSPSPAASAIRAMTGAAAHLITARPASH